MTERYLIVGCETGGRFLSQKEDCLEEGDPGRTAIHGCPLAGLNAYINDLHVVTVRPGMYALKYKEKTLQSVDRRELVVPSRAIAELLMREYIANPTKNKENPSGITALTFRALELLHSPSLVNSVIAEAVSYLHTDSLWYYFFDPRPEIKTQQEATWTPIIDKIQRVHRFAAIKTTESVLALDQHPDTLKKASNLLKQEFGPFSLAGFELLTRTLKSFLLSLAVTDNLITPEAAVEAGLLESKLQASKYGRVSDHHDLQESQVRRDTFLSILFLTTDHHHHHHHHPRVCNENEN